MTNSRSARRREIRQNQLLADEIRSAAKQSEALNAFHQKYIQCSDSLLKEYSASENVSNVTSNSLLNIAVEITQKLIRDSSMVAKKGDNNLIEPHDVKIASMNLYKRKGGCEEIQKVMNAQDLPQIGNSAIHCPQLQKILTSTDFADQPIPKQTELEKTTSNINQMEVPNSNFSQIFASTSNDLLAQPFSTSPIEVQKTTSYESQMD